MQIASKQCLWNTGGSGTVVEVEMTEATGLYIRMHFNGYTARETVVAWGDGDASSFTGGGRVALSHTYASHGRYRIRCTNVSNIGLRWLDGQDAEPYDTAVLSVVDYGGTMTGINSGAFTGCTNLERFIAPNVGWCGQRPFAWCTGLKYARIGDCTIHYDGSFQGCTSLRQFTTLNTGCCWSYVWKDCASLRELQLGKVSQLATEDFANTPLLKDIWISDKTVDQILGVAESGNVAQGYGAEFPWGACGDCRFHGTDGIVLGSGTRIS